MRETQPNLPYHPQSLKKDSNIESWIVGRPTSLQRSWGVFTRAIGECYVTDVDQVIGTGK